jgi:hypothetical protein
MVLGNKFKEKFQKKIVKKRKVMRNIRKAQLREENTQTDDWDEGIYDD